MEDLLRIRERLAEDGHWFREEMMGYLLLAHILDLYDIHAKSRTGHNLSERNGDLLRRFIELLYHKEYIKDRSLRLQALHNPSLSDRSLQEGERQACHVLDRPLYDSRDSTPAPPKGNPPEGRCRPDEFFVAFVFQPVRAKTDGDAAVGIPEPERWEVL